MINFDLVGGAGTFVGGVAKIAAGAGIHSSDKHEVGGIGGAVTGASDGDLTIL